MLEILTWSLTVVVMGFSLLSFEQGVWELASVLLTGGIGVAALKNENKLFCPLDADAASFGGILSI